MRLLCAYEIGAGIDYAGCQRQPKYKSNVCISNGYQFVLGHNAVWIGVVITSSCFVP